MSDYIVTGGSGFIGFNFVNYLCKSEPSARIHNIDYFTYAGVLNQKLLSNNNRVTSYIRDITSPLVIPELKGKKYKALVHFAAESHVCRSFDNIGHFFNVNTMGTLNVLKLAKELDIEKIILISTDEVYGELTKDGDSFREDKILEPNNPYSSSKAAGEFIGRAFLKTHKMPIIITRSSNNFGEYQYTEKLIPYIITQAIMGAKINIHGNGENIRDWIHVKDNCHALLNTIQFGKVGEVYNIGGGIEMSNINLTRYILERMGKSEDLIQFGEDRPFNDARYSIDSTKCRAELNWYAEVPFKDAIDETIDFYVKNSTWWERKEFG